MESALVAAGTGIIFAVGPWLAAFITGRQAFHALQSGVASWPSSLGTTRHFSKHVEPIRYWLVVVLSLSTAVVLAAIPIVYFGSGRWAAKL